MTPNIGFFAQSFVDWTAHGTASQRVKATDAPSLNGTTAPVSAGDGIAVSAEARLRNLLDRFRRDSSRHGTLEVTLPVSQSSEKEIEGFGTGDPRMEKEFDLLLRMIAGDEDEYRQLKARFTDLMKAASGQGSTGEHPAVLSEAPQVAIEGGSPQPTVEASISTQIASEVQTTVARTSSGVNISVDPATGRPIPLNEAMTTAVQQAREIAEQTGASSASRAFNGGEVHLQFERVNGRVEISDLRFVAVQGKADPLVLDLEGDGIDLVSPENGATFDINGDGTLDKTGWVKGDDALLVMDRNNNGTIDDGTELFGDQNGAANGFEELGKLDANKDGVVDRRDPLFRALKLYRDINSNGRIDRNELIPLDAAGVVTISLSFLRQPQEQHGNTLLLNGSFTTADGRQGRVADVLFGYQRAA